MTRRLLVMGSGPTLFADLAALGPFDGDVLAVNRAGVVAPADLAHWVSLHPDHLAVFAAERAARGLPAAGALWTPDRHPSMPRSGSSSLFAVRLALGPLGYDRVVLAGVPMETEPGRPGHFYPEAFPAAIAYRGIWRAAREELAGRVRSLSGWTRRTLGRPSPAWLAGRI